MRNLVELGNRGYAGISVVTWRLFWREMERRRESFNWVISLSRFNQLPTNPMVPTWVWNTFTRSYKALSRLQITFTLLTNPISCCEFLSC